jgi:hypothetical protein
MTACSFTARDVYRNQWAGLTKPADVEEALDRLVALNWLRAAQNSGAGRPSIKYLITPKA